MATRKFSPSREFQLVAACCAWPPSESRTEAIRKAAQEPLDWERFARLAARHRVAGLVHNAIMRARPAIPSPVAENIRLQAAELAQHDLMLAAEAVRLQWLFVQKGIAVTFLKGSTLGILAYGQLGLRHGKDIDILVSDPDIDAATAILENAGYRRSQSPKGLSDTQLRMWKRLRKDFLYVQQTHSHEVELHWRLFDNPAMLNEWFGASPRRTVPIGGEAGLATLGAEDLYAYLCAHGAIHSWMRMKWLADVAALVSVMPDERIEQIHAAAEARNAGSASAQALLLCHRLLQTNIPAALLGRLKNDVNARRLERAGLWALTAANENIAPSELLFGGLRTNFSHFLLARGWRYRVAEFKLFVVSPIDVLMLPLPGPLQFLYPFLRLPLWIWRKTFRR
jgi:hypothetical protein